MADGHLMAVLALLVLTTALVSRATEQPPRAVPRGLGADPVPIGGWSAADGGPTEVAPTDPRAWKTLRWTYRKGDRLVWVVVGFYEARNNPLTRPSVHLIAPERGVIGVDRSAVGIAPSGRVGQQVMVNQLEVRRPQSKLVMYYWYQVGAESIGGEYRFRLTLFRNTVLGKDVPVALVRVSALDGAGSGEAEFLGALLRLVRQAMAGEPP